MSVDSYLELFTTLFGWTFYGVLWDVLVATGIVYLPFLGILIDNWREPAEGDVVVLVHFVGGPEGLTVHSRPDGVEIDVTDTGIGMRPEALAKIFDPFVQADSAVTRR